MNALEIQIGKKKIGKAHPAYIIAEISGNHGGSYEKCKALLAAAKEAGADAIKLQTYTADTITLNCSSSDFVLPSDSPWETSKTLYSLYEKAYTPWEWHKDLFLEAKKLHIDIFSSPFDATAVDLLESLNTPAYKIASPEITDIPLIERVAETKKPIILSTGLATKEDIELAIHTIRKKGNDDIIVLKCTSAYPAPPDSMNLATIADFSTTYNVLAGLSDHSLGTVIPVAAVALGARVIEKHIVFDHSEATVDSFFSLDHLQFKKMVEDIRTVEKAIGHINYEVPAASQQSVWAKRSLYVAKKIQKGEKFTSENIKSVRPAFGLHPKYYRQLLGKPAARNLEKGDRVTLDLLGSEAEVI